MRPWIVRAVLGLAFAAVTAGASFAGTATYTYDALGRVVTATYSDGTVITYTYDSAGNRTAYTIVP